jgi:hypothetical protein
MIAKPPSVKRRTTKVLLLPAVFADKICPLRGPYTLRADPYYSFVAIDGTKKYDTVNTIVRRRVLHGI